LTSKTDVEVQQQKPMNMCAVDSPARLHHECPDGEGPCMLLLHGMLSSRFQWAPNLAALSSRTRPVLLELWGHGRSPTPVLDADYSIEAYVAEFERIRVLMGAPEVVMAGQSFGAGLAMHYAIRHPQRVRALVITNSISAFSNPGDGGTRHARERMASEIEAGGATAIRALPIHPSRAKRLPQDLKAQLVAAADAVDPVAVARSIRLTAPQASVAGLLHHIACPVLLVNGQHEARFQRYRDLAAAGIARCEVADLSAGHAVNLEAAMAFDQAVLDFLSKT
jgi:pimeloyl-ACP methyl ester carboxylesterase